MMLPELPGYICPQDDGRWKMGELCLVVFVRRAQQCCTSVPPSTSTLTTGWSDRQRTETTRLGSQLGDGTSTCTVLVQGTDLIDLVLYLRLGVD